jgi:hypothetical protein
MAARTGTATAQPPVTSLSAQLVNRAQEEQADGETIGKLRT